MQRRNTNDRVSRRRFIGATALLSVATLAGCTSSGSEDVGGNVNQNVAQKRQTASLSRTRTRSPTATQSQTPTATQSPSPTATPSPTPTPSPTAEPTIEWATEIPDRSSSTVQYPSYSGTQIISGDRDYWSFKLDVPTNFVLEYSVQNLKSHDYDFDVFVFSAAEYDDYVTKVRGGYANPNAINDASYEGVETTARRRIALYEGTYYFVVDNTDIGDAGDFGHESTREMSISLKTYEY